MIKNLAKLTLYFISFTLYLLNKTYFNKKILAHKFCFILTFKNLFNKMVNFKPKTHACFQNINTYQYFD